MDYSHINLFLEKFKKLVATSEGAKYQVIEVLEKNLNTKIDPNDITIKAGIVKTNFSPIRRSELMMKKQKILKDLRELNANIKIQDFH